MEKIYMEESKKQKKSVWNFSVVLSFAVAIFAVFSLTMFGIVSNQGTGVSYAAVTGESFNLTFGDEIIAKSGDNVYSYSFHPYYNGSASIENQIFCIERRLNVENNKGYSRTYDARPDGQLVSVTTQTGEYSLSGTPDLSKDYGLMYLLSVGQSSYRRKSINSNDTISGWVVQSAIWKYLALKYPNAEAFKLFEKIDNSNSLSDLRVMNSTTVIIGGTSYTGLSAEIDNLIAEANSKTTPRVIVTKADAEVSKTSDGGYYQSALITVTGDPSDNFLEYAVVLDSEDAIIVDENGEKLPSSVGDAQPTYISSTNKFYVRIPVDKVTEEVKKVNVKINGTFADGTLNYYKVADDKLQRMASVSPISVPAATEVEFVTTGDTGMNTAQTIYFIGLIVLLCGVGIVYANAKPVESKQ